MRRLLILVSLAASTSFAAPADHPESQLSTLLGPAKSVQVVGSGGVAVDIVPIQLPPGRRGVQPKLNLQYSSAAGNGPLGRGWMLNLGFIERNRTNGAPTVESQITYTYSFNGSGGSLVFANGNGSYRAKLENVYVEFFYSGASTNQWVAIDGQGGVYRFVLAPLADSYWVLSSASDAAGNIVNYTYLPGSTSADGAVEPPRISEIRYTAFASDPGNNSVQFEWENRLGGGDQRLSYARGYPERRTQRIKAVVTKTGARTVRRYEMVYTASPQTGESLLTHILLRAGTEQPYVLRKLTYASFTRGWAVPDQEGQGLGNISLVVKDPSTNTPTDSGQRILDVTGDGLVDAIRLDSTDEEFTQTFGVGEGNTYFDESSDEAWGWRRAALNVVHGCDEFGDNCTDEDGVWFIRKDRDGNNHRVDGGLRLLDLNGDGKPDFVIMSPEHNRNEVWLNTGSKWVRDPEFSLALGALQLQADSLGFKIELADGSGNPTGVQFVDLNGDGRPDFVVDTTMVCWNNHTRRMMVRLNTGHGFIAAPTFEAKLTTLPPLAWNERQVNGIGTCHATTLNNAGTDGVEFLDVNGDGYSDYVQTRHDAQQVLLNNGAGTFVANTPFTDSLRNAQRPNNAGLALISTDGQRSYGLMPVDLNADGLPDYVRMVCTYTGNFCTGNEVTEAWLNTGSGWVRDDTLSEQVGVMANWQSGSFVNNQGGQGGAVFADLDGDGLQDLVLAPGGSQGAAVYFSGGKRATRVTPWRKVTQPIVRVETALGEVVELDYGSSAWRGGGSSNSDFDHPAPPYHLPQAMPVVVSMKRSDGRNTITYVYDYAQGVYRDNQFLGFGSVRAIVLSPNGWSPSGLTRVMQFYQDEGLVGQIKRDVLANGLSEHTETWERINDGPVTQLRLVATDEYVRDPGAPVKHKRVTQTYDQYLNRKVIVRSPDVGVDPEVTTTFDYVPRNSSLFWNMVSQIRVQGPDAQSLTRLRYDNGAFNQVPTHGLISDTMDALDVANGVFLTKHTEFDVYGNPTSTTDREGKVSTFEYDDATHTFVVKATDPAGNFIVSTTDTGHGGVLTQADASGARTLHTYDGFGRLLTQTLPGDVQGTPTIAFSYSPPSGAPSSNSQWVQVRQRTSTQVLTSLSLVDGWGQAYRIISGDGVVNIEYDDLGNQVSQSSPAITYVRDSLRRPLTVTGADGRAQTFVYQGRTTLTTNPAGDVTRYVRDGNNNLIEMRQATPTGEQLTRYQFDALGRLIKTIDALGAVTTMVYDDLGRRTSMTEPSAGTFWYRYDKNSRLTAQTHANGNESTFTYGDDGSFTGKTYGSGQSASFVFGSPGASNYSAGRLTSVTDPAGTLQLTYDIRGRVVERRRTIGSNLPGAGTMYLTGYRYDSLDRLTHVTTPDGLTSVYTYDQHGRLSAIVDQDGHVVVQNQKYTDLGQLTHLEFGNGITASLQYDPSMRLGNKTTARSDGTALQSLTYAYDLNGNVKRIEDSVGGNAADYEYDSTGRLTRAVAGWGEETYAYDVAGNMTRKGAMGFALDPSNPQKVLCAVDLVRPPSMSAMAAQPDLQPCRDLVAQSGGTPRASGPIGTRAYSVSYDSRGNVVQKGDLAYEYDDEGHLTRVLQGTRELERNVYDAAGQRVLHITPEGAEISIDGVYEDRISARRVEHHILAGQTVLATFETGRPSELISELPPAIVLPGPQPPPGPGCAAVGGRVSEAILMLAALGLLAHRRRRFQVQRPLGTLIVALLVPAIVLYTPTARAAPDQRPLPRTWFYYHTDHVGSTSLITDDAQNVVARREYKPYGDPVGSTTQHAELGASFNGKKYDAVTGLYYFGARHYDAAMGRFLSPDTQVPDTNDARGLLRYAFGANNPIRYIDPSGHNWLSVLITVLVTILIVAVAIAITIATGGVGGILLGALAGAALGAGGGAAVGLLEGKSGSDLYYSIAVGAVLGALTGAAAGMSVANIGLSGAALAAFDLAKDMTVAAALGALGQAIPDQANGVDPRTSLVNCLISAGISVAFAGVGAGAGKLLSSGLKALSGRLAGSAPEVAGAMTVLSKAPGGKAIDFIEFTLTVGMGVLGGPSTNIDSYAQEAANASLNAQTPQGYTSFVPPTTFSDSSRDPRASLNFAPVTP